MPFQESFIPLGKDLHFPVYDVRSGLARVKRLARNSLNTHDQLLIVLYGDPGVGKSTLARVMAETGLGFVGQDQIERHDDILEDYLIGLVYKGNLHQAKRLSIVATAGIPVDVYEHGPHDSQIIFAGVVAEDVTKRANISQRPDQRLHDSAMSSFYFPNVIIDNSFDTRISPIEARALLLAV